MNKIVACAFVLLLAACGQSVMTSAPLAFPPGEPPPLIPQPAALTHGTGQFVLTLDTPVVAAADDAPARQAAAHFVRILGEHSPQHLSVRDQSPAPAIVFVTDPELDTPAEGYVLDVSPGGITISAGDGAGLFYGAVSLWQLLSAPQTDFPVAIPALKINDAPRFRWRGFMLDSARQMRSVEHIKRMLEQMARHKLNTFHWHLTDDQGWRLEIKRYPRLTEVGAWRIPAGKAGVDADGNPVRYGGFYTQDEAREIVEYARQLHITVVPEIEMPGHAQASIAAYPQLGAGGKTPSVSHDWGVHTWLYNVEDSTFEFLENVLLEVMEIFPGEYIHIGGDEAAKYQWRHSPKVQARRRELGLADDDALQSWFVRRIGGFLAEHQRRLLGWDEILDGGPLPPGATIMSWRGMEGAIAAAHAGHDSVLTPDMILYLNHVQSLAADEPPGQRTYHSLEQVNTLETVYRFEPVPAQLDEQQARHILGTQANVWGEHVRTEARVEYMVFPRLSALAEVAWSAKDVRDWNGFLPRLAVQMRRFARAGIGAADSAFAAEIKAQAHLDGARLSLGNQTHFGELRYTLDGSEPGPHSPLYTAPLTVGFPTTITANAFFDGKALARPRHLTVDALALRTRRPEQLAACPNNEPRAMLRVEDDEPLVPEHPDERIAVPVNIATPCWYWPQAELDGITQVRVQAVDLPWHFQHGDATAEFVPPAPAPVDLEIRLNGCDTPVVASARIIEQSGALKQLDAAFPVASGAHDLCLKFSGDHRRILWAIERVQLLNAQEVQ